MAANKQSLQTFGWQKRGKGVTIIGAALLTLGVLSTIATVTFAEQIWIITPVVAVVGAFVLIFGLLTNHVR